MERERLTITLRKDVLKLVDQSIDGAKLRNRSHAIEYFLSQQLAGKTARVVLVLNNTIRTLYQAGSVHIGMKGQMSMAGEANFKRILETVSTQGFKDVLIVGSDATSVAAAEVDAENMELNAKTLIIEGVEAAAPEVALGHIESALRDETFVYWDTRFGGTVNLADLLDFHKASKAVATIAVAQSSGSGAGAGLVGQLYGSKVVKMGTVESAGGGLSVTGVMVFEPTVFTSLSKGKQLYKEVLPRLSQEGKLHGFAFMPQQERVTAQTR